MKTPKPTNRPARHRFGKGRWIALGTAAAVLAAAGGGAAYYRNGHRAEVNVYGVANLAITDYWGDSATTGGTVRENDLQTVFLSQTQTLSEILVTEGQEVKKGDPLFTYDSTLTDLDLGRAEITVQQKKLDLEKAQEDLKTIKSYKAGVPIPGSQHYYSNPNYNAGGDSDEPQSFLLTPSSGSGSQEDPYRFEWSDLVSVSGGVLNEAGLSQLAQGRADAYVLLHLSDLSQLPSAPADGEESASETETVPDAQEPAEESPEESASEDPEDPMGTGTLSQTTGSAGTDGELLLQVQEQEGVYSYAILGVTVEGYGITLSDPLPAPQGEEQEEPQETEPAGYYDEGIVYTAAELAKMRESKEEQIRSLELDIRQAELNLKKLTAEADGNTVRSELDGVVVMVTDPAQASDSVPLVKVSAGGSYLVDAQVGELDLDKLQVGQAVTVNVMGESFQTCEGVITQISDYPTAGESYYGGGNSNVSYYPFTVQLSGDYDLDAGDYAEVTYSDAQQEGGLYLDNMYLRSENGKSYVYADEDGTLKKRFVVTGGSLWGSYTKITAGLTTEDFVAFPYGKTVKDGVKARQADIDELYANLY